MMNNSFTVKYITSRDCFLALSETNIQRLSYHKIVKLTSRSKAMYFSCIRSIRINDNNIVGIPSSYGKAIGISENESVFLTDIIRLPVLGEITITPLSSEDYEILQTASEQVQSTMLEQVRVLNRDQKLVLWISKWLHAAVKVEDTDSLEMGVIANLTEVHINNPFIAPPPKKIDNKINNIIKKNDSPKKEIIPERKKVDTPETNEVLKKLKKYMDIKDAETYRVHPFSMPENVSKNDMIANQPFNVFIHKNELPSFIEPKNYRDVLLCKIEKVEAPSDFRENKDEPLNNNEKNNLVVRICVIDEYNFSQPLQDCFKKNLHCDKYPIMYMSEHTMSTSHIIVGSKISIGNSFPFQPKVSSVEIITANKKNLNIVQQYRTYLAEQVKHGKCVINADFCLEITPKITCAVTFSPRSQFCLFDEDVLRVVKTYENVEQKLMHEKSEINISLIDTKKVYDDCAVYKKIIEETQQMLSWKDYNENVFIVGKPGTGKTTLGKYICQNLSGNPTYKHVVYKSCKALKGKAIETLHKIFSQDIHNMIYYQPSVLLLDDLDVICGKSETANEVQSQESMYFNRVSEMLCELLETCQHQHQISVIATCQSILKMNDNIYSPRGKHLFKNIYTITEITKVEREKILRNFFHKRAYVGDNIDFNNLAVKTEGFVMHDLVDLVTKSVFEALKRDSKNSASKPVIKIEDIETAHKVTVGLALRDVELHSPGDKNFKDVGGLEDVKKILIESLRWPSLYPKLFEDAPLRLQSGMLLYGPPGVGKTLLVGATAKQCNIRLITVKGPELLSKYVGASEQAVRGIFEKAQSARPCILFFDEFDSLAPRRGHDSTGVTDRVVNQLLTQLDGVESLTGVFVIAATSRPDLLDPALLRPGRLDRQLFCTVPELSARLAILKALSRSLVLDKDVDLKKVATSTKGFSGADLQAVLYTAQLFAVEETLVTTKDMNVVKAIITSRHLDAALRNTSPSLNKLEIAKYDKIYAKFQGKKEDTTEMMKKQKATLA